MESYRLYCLPMFLVYFAVIVNTAKSAECVWVVSILPEKSGSGITVYRDTNVVLQCHQSMDCVLEVTSKKTVLVEWRGPQGVIENRYSSNIHVLGNNELQIEKITTVDNGAYSCVVYTKDKELMKSKDFTVYVRQDSSASHSATTESVLESTTSQHAASTTLRATSSHLKPSSGPHQTRGELKTQNELQPWSIAVITILSIGLMIVILLYIIFRKRYMNSQSRTAARNDDVQTDDQPRRLNNVSTERLDMINDVQVNLDNIQNGVHSTQYDVQQNRIRIERLEGGMENMVEGYEN